MSRMKKIKLDDFNLRLLVTGLYKTLDEVPAEDRNAACDVILRLIDIDEALRPGRKKKVPFEPVDRSYIRRSLLLWRNMVIDEEGPTEDIDSLIVRFSK